MGFAWLRAGGTKLVSEKWLSGETLSTFFIEHGQPSFALRHEAPEIFNVFMEFFNSYGYSLITLIPLLQVLAGLLLLTGFFYKSGACLGIFLNFNFVAAGVILPSFFYILLQLSIIINQDSKYMSMESLMNLTPITDVAYKIITAIVVFFVNALAIGIFITENHINFLNIEDASATYLTLSGIYSIFFLISVINDELNKIERTEKKRQAFLIEKATQLKSYMAKYSSKPLKPGTM